GARRGPHHQGGLLGPELHLHHAPGPRGHPVPGRGPGRHPGLPGGRGPVPHPVRDRGVPRSPPAVRADPGRHGRRDPHGHQPDLGHGQREEDPRGGGADLAARERRRRALLHGHRRPLQGRARTRPRRDPEVEGDLPGAGGRLRRVQGLHPHPEQRRREERLRGPAVMDPVIVLIILVALAFDFLNGFHDAANSIATVVSTRVLSPQKAVLWAAFFNFVAAFVLGTHVAKTMGKGMIDLDVVTREVILAGLIGAITWNLVTWYYGLPVSSSHALIGGYAGAAVAKAGPAAILLSGWSKTLMFIVLAPLMGAFLGFFLMVSVTWIFRRWHPFKLDQLFRRLQLLSAGLYSLGQGGNDAQKTMGIITGLLVSSGLLAKFEVPLWVILISHAAIALGTMFGGWRIVKTMGTKITKLQPIGGFCAETAGAITLVGATLGGIPVSTTHTITGAIIGVGSTRRISAVKWGVAGRILWAWILTIPISAAIAALAYLAVSLIH